MASSGADEARPSPGIILGDRSADGGKWLDKHVPDIMDWNARFGRRSPLTRKIITFNLIALGMLVAGVLYLNQIQGGLTALREEAMIREARILAVSVQESLGSETLEGAQATVAAEMLQRFSGSIAGTARLYDAQGTFIASSDETSVALSAQANPTLSEQNTGKNASVLNDVWERLARRFSTGGEVDDAPLSSESADRAAGRAAQGSTAYTYQSYNSERQSIVTIAVPIIRNGETIGAVALTSRAGEIDALVRGERESILEVFALAMISSIVLSFVLANTIVRPLRDLAEAAQKGGTSDSKRVNPERIHIPDMRARPDEIGYLSGAMRMMVTALYDRVEANEVFAADVAHEIKNPLTSLRSAVETLQYAKDDISRQRLMSVIQKDVDRLNRLVTDISNASRLDRELVRDEMARFDLGSLLRNLVEFNMEGAIKRGAELIADLPAEALVLSGLEARLAQVFVNLITNALSFSHEGDVVKVGVRRVGQIVRITVEDTGPGIPNANLADVFGRFYSERPDKEFGNHSGLGLAISKQIIEAHGGKIWAENIRSDGAGADSPPEGARFVVELPG